MEGKPSYTTQTAADEARSLIRVTEVRALEDISALAKIAHALTSELQQAVNERNAALAEVARLKAELESRDAAKVVDADARTYAQKTRLT